MFGPFFRSYTTPYNGQTSSFRSVWYYKQKAPYIDRLPVVSHNSNWRRIPNPWFASDSSSNMGDSIFTSDPAYSRTYNRAYDSFRGGLGDYSQIGADLGERAKSIDMIRGRLVQLTRFVRALRRFRFGDAASVLGLTCGPQRNVGRFRSKLHVGSHELNLRRSAKSLGNNFLEFHFGWEPLVKEIGSLLDFAIEKPFPSVYLKGRASERGPSTFTIPSLNDGTFGDSYRWEWCKVQILGTAVITNPNLYTLSRLGLINPASVAWELVPFSFVVDWFTNVGQVLNSYTDFAGVTLKNVSTTHFTCVSVRRYYRGYWYSPYPGTAAIWEYRQISLKRTLGTSGPTLSVRALKLPSVTRALTACSLLTQGLRGH